MSPRRRRDQTPDSHLFPTRPYDLVKEFVIALVVVGLLTGALAACFPRRTARRSACPSWAQAAPDDVVATATAELAGTSTSASYGPPYNHADVGQKLLGLTTQKWGGVRIPVDSANQLVIDPLHSVSNDPKLTAALQDLGPRLGRPADQVGIGLLRRDRRGARRCRVEGEGRRLRAGPRSSAPSYLALAGTGGLEGLLTTKNTFYNGDETKPLLLLADGAYLEDQARAEHLGGDQWGMMNETGSYPGQPWMWLYTFWYQVKPFSTSGNADALVWGLMAVLSLGFVFLPFIPGLRSLPKHLGVHRLIWRRA